MQSQIKETDFFQESRFFSLILRRATPQVCRRTAANMMMRVSATARGGARSPRRTPQDGFAGRGGRSRPQKHFLF